MRHPMSAHAEKSRTEQRLRARRQDLSAPPAVRRLLVSAREVALRTVHSLVARARGTSDQIAAASPAHARPWPSGVVHHDRLDHPDLPAVLSNRGRRRGKPILHPRRPAEGRLAGQTTSRRCCPSQATSAVCPCELAVARPGRTATTGERERHRGRGRAAMPVEEAGLDAGPRIRRSPRRSKDRWIAQAERAVTDDLAADPRQRGSTSDRSARRVVPTRGLHDRRDGASRRPRRERVGDQQRAARRPRRGRHRPG